MQRVEMRIGNWRGIVACLCAIAWTTSAAGAVRDCFEADFASGIVYRFAPSGSKTIFASGLAGLEGLAQDAAGNVFVSEYPSELSGKRDALLPAVRAFVLPQNFIRLFPCAAKKSGSQQDENWRKNLICVRIGGSNFNERRNPHERYIDG